MHHSAPLINHKRTNSRSWASSKSSKEHGLATGALLTNLLHPELSSPRLTRVFSLFKIALLWNLKFDWVGRAPTSWSVRRKAAGTCSQVKSRIGFLKVDTEHRQKEKVYWDKPCRIRKFNSFSNARFEKVRWCFRETGSDGIWSLAFSLY